MSPLLPLCPRAFPPRSSPISAAPAPIPGSPPRSNGASGGRCLIVADGFYEYTAPAGGGGRSVKKDRWLFTRSGEDFFCIAGIWRTDPKVGEACTMLTVEPGPDVAPYHGRQIVVLERGDWRHWLEADAPAAELLKPSPAGTFEVRRA